jgi:hypothetical protein
MFLVLVEWCFCSSLSKMASGEDPDGLTDWTKVDCCREVVGEAERELAKGKRRGGERAQGGIKNLWISTWCD